MSVGADLGRVRSCARMVTESTTGLRYARTARRIIWPMTHTKLSIDGVRRSRLKRA